MLNQLLETIIQILTGWLNKFDSHSQHVEDKLDSLDQTASDIETNTEPISDIKDNTGAVVTPIQNIKSNTDSIKQSSQTSANNTTAILNNVSTLSTNTGRAAAFAEDCANNTLDIKDKVTTIASDTTQIRANTAAIDEIKDLMQYYFINTIVTEDSEGVIANFDTDLEDYLQKAVVTIPADPTGYTGITLTKCGKNLFDKNAVSNNKYLSTTTGLEENAIGYVVSDYILVKAGVPVVIPASGSARRWFYDINKQPITYLNNTNLQVFTPNIDGFIRVTFNVSSSSGIDINLIQIEIGTSQSSFESYKNITYPVSFGSTITDGAEADLLNGLVKVNTTPESYIPITPSAIRTYKEVNNIFSDVGSTALTYRETLKKFIEKHNQ